MSLIIVILILTTIYFSINLTRWYKKRKKLIDAIEKLPGPPNIPYFPILNHALVIVYLDSLKHKLGTFTLVYHVMSNMYRLFPDTGICRFWLGPKPIVVLYSPETVESVLVSTSVINKADEYRFFEPWIGEGLVTSKKTKWRFRRKILTPAFHFRILNDFLPIMNQEATILVKKLNQMKYLSKDKVIDITPLIAFCTLDTICETAMGVNINCQDDEDSVYVRSLNEVGEMALCRVTRPWLWFDFIFYRTEAGRRFTNAKNIMQKFTTKVILERKKEWEKQLLQDKSIDNKDLVLNDKDQENNFDKDKEANMTFDDMRSSSFFTTGNKKLAFLDLMLHQHLIENTMSLEDVREEVDTFMFAGHDTTAMSISWALYMLGLHEDIQSKAREELDRIVLQDTSEYYDLNSNEKTEKDVLAKELKVTDITIEHIREMKYLDRVIKELLRMWPSIPFVARQMTQDLTVDNKYLIPEGATCMIFTQCLHNNPKYFPRPEVFDPDRFLPENSLGRHPFAYIPFSAGPRNCIGQKFAQMEIKVILAKIIRNYYIKTHDHRDKLAVVGELVLRSRNGLNIKLTPRFR